MAQIRVTGMGETSAAPDEASFHFSCEGRAADGPTALAQATHAAESVIALLDDVGIDPNRRGVQRARVHPRTRWHNDREVRDGWDANASVECTIDDASKAFDVLDRAAALEQVGVHGPHWKIRRDNPAHDDCRRLAVEDARQRAASYADAAGLELGELVELIEGGANRGEPMMRSMAAAESASIEPADQSVRAAVTLVFDTKS